MSTTNPSDIASLSHDGKSETTDATNALAGQPGFPIVVKGEVVNIIEKQAQPQGQVLLIADNGDVYVEGLLGEYELAATAEERVAAATVQLDAETGDGWTWDEEKTGIADGSVASEQAATADTAPPEGREFTESSTEATREQTDTVEAPGGSETGPFTPAE